MKRDDDNSKKSVYKKRGVIVVNPNQRLLDDNSQLPPSVMETHIAQTTRFDQNHESVRFSINSTDNENRVFDVKNLIPEDKMSIV